MFLGWLTSAESWWKGSAHTPPRVVIWALLWHPAGCRGFNIRRGPERLQCSRCLSQGRQQKVPTHGAITGLLRRTCDGISRAVERLHDNSTRFPTVDCQSWTQGCGYQALWWQLGKKKKWLRIPHLTSRAKQKHTATSLNENHCKSHSASASN